MSLWEKNVRKVVPYVPGEQPGQKDIIKLNTNENPYPPSPAVKKAIEDFDCADLRKYPDPMTVEIRDAIAGEYGLKRENVFAGVGSDDVLSLCFLTFFNSNLPVLFPDISYSFYEVWADCYGIDYKKIPLKNDFSLDCHAFDIPCGGIVIANPNAPTSLYEDADSFARMAEKHPDAVLVVDEAYIDFGGESAYPFIKKYDNLLVVRTFSKSRSMAGTRLGYALGSEKLIKALYDVRNSINSYTLDTLSIRVGTAAMKDREYFDKTTKKIIATRERTASEMRKMGFEVLDSKTNFLFATHEKLDAAEVLEDLKKHNIYVRYFDRDRIRDYLRITIGTDREMDILLDYFKELLTED